MDMESIFNLCDLVEVKVEDSEMLAKIHCEDIEVVKKYLDVSKEIKELKVDYKLTKKAIKILKQERLGLKNCLCKCHTKSPID